MGMNGAQARTTRIVLIATYEDMASEDANF